MVEILLHNLFFNSVAWRLFLNKAYRNDRPNIDFNPNQPTAKKRTILQ